MEIIRCENCRVKAFWSPNEKKTTFTLEIDKGLETCELCHHFKHNKTRYWFCSNRCLTEFLKKEGVIN